MERKYMRYFKNGVLGAAVIAGCSACTDTIDEHYAVSEGVAKASLWEQIVSQPDLQNFAKILEKVHYYTDQTKKTNNTYKDILQQNTKVTVWAPVDGSYNADSILACLENDEYSVDHRFVRNHINTFTRNISGSEVDSITMLNSKMNVLNKAEQKFKDVNIVESNIPASNGVLHKLESSVPFLENLYEYIQTNPNLSSLNLFFHERDTTILNEFASVPGAIQDGEKTWADSVMYTYTKAFELSYELRGEEWQGLGEYLDREDSTFVMVMPTDAGWQDALAKTYPYYKYMSFTYANKNNSSDKGTTVVPDTLQKKQSLMSIVNRLGFSPNRQKDYTLEDFGNTDSLFTFRNEIIPAPYCNNIFKGITPVKLSNGYAYLTDEYRFNVSDDIEFEAEFTPRLYGEGINIATQVNTATIPTGSKNPKIKGYVSGNSYVYTYGLAGNSATNISYTLPNVLSAKYDIYAVILPENIQDTVTAPLQLKFNATLGYYKGTSEQEATETSEKLYNDTTKVDTILLFKDFEFPVAYKGVDNAYPTLTLKVAATANEIRNKKYSNSIYLDKIILKTKEEE